MKKKRLVSPQLAYYYKNRENINKKRRGEFVSKVEPRNSRESDYIKELDGGDEDENN